MYAAIADCDMIGKSSKRLDYHQAPALQRAIWRHEYDSVRACSKAYQ
jgi:hypothetical protein